MKKKLLTISLLVIALCGLFCTSALADGGVAQVGEEQFATLQEAITCAASGDIKEVKILSEAADNESAVLPVGVTLVETGDGYKFKATKLTAPEGYFVHADPEANSPYCETFEARKKVFEITNYERYSSNYTECELYFSSFEDIYRYRSYSDYYAQYFSTNDISFRDLISATIKVVAMETEVELTNRMEFSTSTLLSTSVFPNITLDLNGHTLKRSLQEAAADGSVIYLFPPSVGEIDSNKLTVKNGTVTGGWTTGEGGGICANYTTLILENVTVSGNKSVGNGGGVYAGRLETNAKPETGDYVRITGNTSGGNGGGVYSGRTTLKDCVITGNTSAATGGGIYVSGGTVTTVSGFVQITGNQVKPANGDARENNYDKNNDNEYIWPGTLTDGSMIGLSSSGSNSYTVIDFPQSGSNVTHENYTTFFKADNAARNLLYYDSTYGCVYCDPIPYAASVELASGETFEDISVQSVIDYAQAHKAEGETAYVTVKYRYYYHDYQKMMETVEDVKLPAGVVLVNENKVNYYNYFKGKTLEAEPVTAVGPNYETTAGAYTLRKTKDYNNVDYTYESIAVTVEVTMPGKPVLTFGSLEEAFASSQVFSTWDSGIGGYTTVTYKMLADETLSHGITFSKYGTYILDLNGHTIDRGLSNAEDPAEDGYILLVGGEQSNGGINFTVTDSSEGKTGKLTGAYTKSDSHEGSVIVHLKSGSFKLEGGAITGNRTKGNGGGIRFSSVESATLYISGGTISNNTAGGCGGGIYVEGPTNYAGSNSVFFESGKIENNTAGGSGGGIYLMGRVDFTMLQEDAEAKDNGSAVISGNTAKGSGGGIYMSISGNYLRNFNVYGGTITGNTAGEGGGIYLSDEGEKRFSATISGIIRNNRAEATATMVDITKLTDEQLKAGYEAWGQCDKAEYKLGGTGGGIAVDGYYTILTLGTETNGLVVEENCANIGGGIFMVEYNGVTGRTVTLRADVKIDQNNYFGCTVGGVEYTDLDKLNMLLEEYSPLAPDLGMRDLVFFSSWKNPSPDTATYTMSFPSKYDEALYGDYDNHASWKDGSVVSFTTAKYLKVESRDEFVPIERAVSNSAKIVYDSGKWSDYIVFSYSDNKYSAMMSNNTLYVVKNTVEMDGKKYADLATAAELAPDNTPTDVKLLCDAAVTEAQIIPAGKNITFDLNGYALTGTGTSIQYVITVNGKLTVKDSSQEKTGKISGMTRGNAAVCVEGGELTLESGAITGNTGIYYGGVYVNDQGKFTMNGGSITDNSGNSGGGVYVKNQSEFTMNGGTISGNTAPNGGAVYLYSSDFTMTNGSITDNVSSNGSTIYATSGSNVTLNAPQGKTVTITGNKGKVATVYYGFNQNDPGKLALGGNVIIKDNVLTDDAGQVEKVDILTFYGSTVELLSELPADTKDLNFRIVKEKYEKYYVNNQEVTEAEYDAAVDKYNALYAEYMVAYEKYVEDYNRIWPAWELAYKAAAAQYEEDFVTKAVADGSDEAAARAVWRVYAAYSSETIDESDSKIQTAEMFLFMDYNQEAYNAFADQYAQEHSLELLPEWPSSPNNNFYGSGARTLDNDATGVFLDNYNAAVSGKWDEYFTYTGKHSVRSKGGKLRVTDASEPSVELTPADPAPTFEWGSAQTDVQLGTLTGESFTEDTATFRSGGWYTSADGTTPVTPAGLTASVDSATGAVKVSMTAETPVGSYYLKVLAENNSVVPAESAEDYVCVTVAKCSTLPEDTPKSKTVKGMTNKAGQSGDIDLTLLGVTLPGAAIKSFGTESDASGIVTIDTSAKTYTFANTSAAATATLELTISSTNYQDFTYTLTFETVDKTEVTITAAADGFTYGNSGKVGYKNASAKADSAEVSGLAATLLPTYYLSDGTTKTTTANSGAATEGAVPKNAGTYKVVLSVPETNETYIGSSEPIAFTIAKADITPTVSITGWTYGATANSPSVDGNAGSGNVTYQYKLKTADDSAYDSAVPSAAGEYTVKATVAETAHYNCGSDTEVFTIAKVTLTMTGAAASKTYDGTDTATVIKGTLNGVIAADTGKVSVSENSVSGTYDSANVGTGKTVTLTASFTLSGDAAGNYTLTQPTVTGTITAFDLSGATLTPDPNGYDYTGAEVKPAPSVTFDGTNAIPADDYTLSYENNTNAALSTLETGAPTVTVTAKTTNVTGSKSAKFTINKIDKPAGTPTSYEINAMTTGTLSLETIGITLAGAKITGVTPVVTGKVLSAAPSVDSGDVSISWTTLAQPSGTENDQYKLTISSDNWKDFTVTVTFKGKIPVTVSGLTAANAAYDAQSKIGVTGTAVCTANSANVTSGCGTLVYTYYKDSVDDANKLAGAPVDAGNYVLVVSVPDGNATYIGESAPYTFSIAQKEIRIDWAADNFTYNNADQTTSITASYEDIAEASHPLIVAVNKTFMDAGEYTAEVTDFDIGNDPGSKNYKLPETVTKTYTMQQASVTVLDVTVQDKTYNEKTDDAAFTGAAVFEGLYDGDTLTLGGVTGTYASANAGSQRVTLGGTWALTGASAANYKLAEDGHVTYAFGKIAKAPQAAPTAPTVSVSTVTIAEADWEKKLEYCVDDNKADNEKAWISVPTLDANGAFTLSGLAAGNHTVYLRVKESGNYFASSSVSRNFNLTQFSVAYNANGGVGSIASQTATAPATLTVASGSAMSRTGHTFNGWNTKADGTGAAYAAGSSISTGATLYAQWMPNTYTAQFNANGGSGTMANESFTYDAAKNLTRNTFTRTDYTFVGWATSANGPVLYSDEQEVKNLAGSGTVTLYAIWAQNVYSIHVDITSPQEGKVDVKLRQGNAVYAVQNNINMSENDGNYTVRCSFTNVPAGTYNIEVMQTIEGGKNVTMTQLVVLTANADVTIVLPESGVNSKLEVEKDTLPTVVGGLDGEAESNRQTGKDITVKMTVEKKEEQQLAATASEQDKATQDAISEIKATANGKALDFMNIEIEKTTVETGKDDVTEAITETSSVLELVFSYEMNGKKNIQIYRQHGDEVQTFTKLDTKPTTGYEDGKFYVDTANSLIYVYASGFSTYAIGYEQQSSGGGGGVSGYAVESERTKNGTFSVDKKTASAGSTVTVTVTPDKGFTLETLTVTDKSGKAVEIKNLGSNKYSFTMPGSKVAISATFMEDNTMLNFFVDVPATEYYYDAVLWAAENGITTGVDAVHFGPEIGVTRAQVVTFLWRTAGSPEPTGDASKFTDLIPDEYYVKAVAWAIEQGITKGITDTTFEPETVCTRGQIVTFLARFAGVEDADTESVFTDVPANEFFAAAVKWAKDNGVTDGMTATTFEPYTNCNRAQVVTFLYRWMVK